MKEIIHNYVKLNVKSLITFYRSFNYIPHYSYNILRFKCKQSIAFTYFVVFN